MSSLSFQLTYAGIPFIGDQASVLRMGMDSPADQNEQVQPNRKQQPFSDLIDELNKLIDFKFLSDMGGSRPAGRNLDALARDLPAAKWPNVDVPIGCYYYPTSAGRWSVFRGLATSSMAKAMLAQTKGMLPKPFVLKSVPIVPGNPTEAQYTVETNLYMLPPRPLAEHGNQFDGLYLITLVDERYYWQNSPFTFHATNITEWKTLIASLSSVLGSSITIPAVESVYGQPEQDSQLWVNAENAPALLDAVALSVGRVVVRAYDGTYSLLSPSESSTSVEMSRGNADAVVRCAGGDMFSSGTNIKAGNLTAARNAVVPSSLIVTFPKYVQGDDPVPHFLNPRYANQRPSAWFEDSYGSVYSVTIPVQSGGANCSGLSGTSIGTVHSTAKALYSGEIQATPVNSSGLTALALQIAKDYYDGQVLSALDEVYPGTYAWTPEGIHDIVWTYSERKHQASTRIMRAEWNAIASEMQHRSVAMSGYSSVPKGVGGPSVAQNIRDQTSGTISTTVIGISNSWVGSGDTSLTLSTANYFPTQNRWKARVDNEIMLMEGTSGGTDVNIVQRPIDGTLNAVHSGGATLTQVAPNATYGVNLVTHEKGQFVFPADTTSGGIQGIRVVPQTQTVRVLCGTPQTINSTNFYSGSVGLYDPALPTSFPPQENIWVLERNSQSVESGKYYDGQLVGFSAVPARPIYAINEGLTLSDCSPIYLSQNDVRCESGQLNVYQRSIALTYDTGCLSRTYGNYVKLRTEGCCGCSGYPISGEIITSGIYSGQPSSGCYASNCTQVCSGDSPFQYIVPVGGFGGTCQVFNRNWILREIGGEPCRWYEEYPVNNLLAAAEIFLYSGGGASLGFYYGNSGGILFSSEYSGQIQSGNCCGPLEFVQALCECSDTHPPAADECINCVGVSPLDWEFIVLGFTGDFINFNGQWKLTSSLSCVWTQTVGDVTVTLRVLGDEILVTFRDASNLAAANYIIPIDPPIDCCTPYELVASLQRGAGLIPYTIIVVPTCSSQGPGGCPGTIVAVPYCCSGNTVPPTSGGTVDTTCCSGYPFSTTLYGTIHGATVLNCECLNGTSVELIYNGSGWLGTFLPCTSGVSTQMFLQCILTGWAMTYSGGSGACNSQLQLASGYCPSRALYFSSVSENGCCTGNYFIDVTE